MKTGSEECNKAIDDYSRLYIVNEDNDVVKNVSETVQNCILESKCKLFKILHVKHLLTSHKLVLIYEAKYISTFFAHMQHIKPFGKKMRFVEGLLKFDLTSVN